MQVTTGKPSLSDHKLSEFVCKTVSLATVPHKVTVGSLAAVVTGLHVVVDAGRDLNLHLLHLSVGVQSLNLTKESQLDGHHSSQKLGCTEAI